MPMVLFGGFIANNTEVAVWLNWIQYISPVRYAAEALAHTQLDGGPEITEQFLDYEGFTIGYWKCIGCLAGLAIFWRIVSVSILTCFVQKFQ